MTGDAWGKSLNCCFNNCLASKDRQLGFCECKVRRKKDTWIATKRSLKMGKALGQKWGIALAWAQEIKVVKGEWGEKGLGWWLNKARTQKINQRSEKQHNLKILIVKHLSFYFSFWNKQRCQSTHWKMICVSVPVRCLINHTWVNICNPLYFFGLIYLFGKVLRLLFQSNQRYKIEIEWTTKYDE